MDHSDVEQSGAEREFDVVGIGLNATDTLLLLEDYPAYAGKVPVHRELMSPGGQVATAIVACASLGLRTKYIGTVGDDIRGKVQTESLAGTGVDTSGLIVRAGCPNQSAFILIDERTGERTVLWRRVDELRLSVGEVREKDVLSARLLHIDGCDVEAAAYAASLARRHGVAVSLDVDTVYPGFEPVLQNVDYLIASSSWPAQWTSEADPCVALPQLSEAYHFKVAAVTLGDRGSLALAQGEWAYSPAFEVDCTDTTGAGDVFHGAFCYAMLAALPVHEALEFANAAAAINCTDLGARGHLPTLAEVEALMAAARLGTVARREDARMAQRASGAACANIRSGFKPSSRQ